MTKEAIEKLKEKLSFGDQEKIARNSGVSKVTVNRFYNGEYSSIRNDVAEKIVRATLDLMEDRQRVHKDLLKRTNQILN